MMDIAIIALTTLAFVYFMHYAGLTADWIYAKLVKKWVKPKD